MRNDDVEDFGWTRKGGVDHEIHDDSQRQSNLLENLGSNFLSFFEIHQSPEN
jgi:hypothetical protein